MATKQTVFIVVSKAWFNSDGVNQILGNGKPSTSTGDDHLIIAGDPDLSDHKGIWLNNVVTGILHRKDRSPVTMKFLIPWQHIFGVGIPAKASAESMIGFTAGNATNLINTEG